MGIQCVRLDHNRKLGDESGRLEYPGNIGWPGLIDSMTGVNTKLWRSWLYSHPSQMNRPGVWARSLSAGGKLPARLPYRNRKTRKTRTAIMCLLPSSSTDIIDISYVFPFL